MEEKEINITVFLYREKLSMNTAESLWFLGGEDVIISKINKPKQVKQNL